MKLVLAGGMSITHQILSLLCESGVRPVHIFGYPPSLRHRSNYQSLGDLAEKYSISLTEVKNINDPVVLDTLQRLKPDWFVVFGWSQLVGEELLKVPMLGTLGFHMTKLPEGRGRAPVAWTVIKGKEKGWVTLIWLKSEADNGDIAVQRSYTISLFDDAETVVEKVSKLACEIIRDSLPDLRNGTLLKTPQGNSKATYWKKRTPEDGNIDWNMPVRELYNLIRGITHPFPGAFSYLQGTKKMIWKVGIIEVELPYPPGRIIGPYFSHGRKYETGMAVTANGGIIIIRLMEDERDGILKGDILVKKAEMWQGMNFESDNN